MDNNWDSVLQYVGDLDLEYNEKNDQVDEGSPTVQIPTPPVSIAWPLFYFILSKTPPQSILMTAAHLSLTVKTKPALSFPYPLLFSLDPSIFQPPLTSSF